MDYKKRLYMYRLTSNSGIDLLMGYVYAVDDADAIVQAKSHVDGYMISAPNVDDPFRSCFGHAHHIDVKCCEPKGVNHE
jgi:hypothetical protein